MLKNRLLILLLPGIICLTGCNCGDIAKEEDKQPAEEKAGKGTVVDGSTAQNSLDVAGTYKGTVPCADCEGIETSIMLHTDNSYMLSVRYLGKGDGKAIEGSGRWKWIDGFRIRLEGISDGPSLYFVSENKLIQLDMEGNRISGELAEKYVLNKVN